MGKFAGQKDTDVSYSRDDDSAAFEGQFADDAAAGYQVGTPSVSRDVRKDLVKAAVGLFFERGYEATGVQEIVDRAGVTKGAMYHYFRSKEELLLEIRNEFMGHLLERGRQILAETASATEALRLMIFDLILQVQERGPNMTVAFVETRVDFKRYPKAGTQRSEWEGILVEIVERGRRTKEFRSAVVPIRAAAMIGTLFWAAYNWFPEEAAHDPQKVAAEFTDIVLHGLAA